MKALTVLFGGRLTDEAFEKILPASGGKSNNGSRESAFFLAMTAASRLPNSERTVFLGLEGKEYPLLPGVEAVLRPSWTKKSVLEELTKLSSGEFHIYFAWADCPLLDPVLSGAIAERHIRYRADYSYADGWPYGFAPELLSPGTAGILAKITENSDGPVERDMLFSVVQKDINSFDIETEISPVDLRPWRLSISADSKRNLLLLSRLIDAGLKSASDAEKFITAVPEESKIPLLRTLPSFFCIQVSGACPQACTICPWPLHGGDVVSRKDFMPKAAFESLLDKITGLAGDAVIDISLWGEAALHPDKIELIQMVLARPALSLIIETSGIGWNKAELEALARSAAAAVPRKNQSCPAPLSWIVSLDAHDPERYREVRGSGFAEANATAKLLLSLFPNDTYVQAVRVKGYEDDIEHFYLGWKAFDQLPENLAKDGKHIIIQKYNDFLGALPKLQASDLSPVKRRPCWHIQRDMYILLDGRVPCCKEVSFSEDKFKTGLWGNAFNEDLSVIWERGASLYLEHCRSEYNENCKNCDEYYTFNF